MSSSEISIRQKRSRRLIKPRLQLYMVVAFTGIAAIAFLLQAVYLAMKLSSLATALPTGATCSKPRSRRSCSSRSGCRSSVLLPLIVAVGVLVTFRVAGPVYRFEKWLEAIAKGEDPGPCRIRRGDQLHELCDRLNQAVEALRAEEKRKAARSTAFREAA